MSHPRPHADVVALILLFFVLGGLYSIANPIFEAPDETFHFAYVRYLVDRRRLPPVAPNDDLWARLLAQESTQPPLYYLLGALATFWIDTGDPSHLYTLNPYAWIGRADAPDNRNRVVHSSAESFPYRGVALAVHLVRLLSLAMGAVTVGLTYLLGRELDPRSAWLARGAGLINALIPQFLFISGAVNNDNLVTLLSSLALLLTVRLVHRPSSSLRGDLLLGATVGLASLAKLSGLLLLPLVVGAVLWWGIRHRSRGRAIARAGLIVGIAVLIGGWWYGRNWLLTGDPTLVRRHLAITGGRSLPLTALQVLLREGEGLRWSFWGVFGWFNVIADRWVYALYDLLGLLALVGLLLLTLRHIRGQSAPSRVLAKASYADNSPPREGPPRAAVVILALWVVLFLAALLEWSTVALGSQGRLLFPAIAPICLALARGWQGLWPGRVSPAWLSSFGTPLLVIALMLPIRTIIPAYRGPVVTPGRVAEADADTAGREIRFGQQIALVRWQLSPDRAVAGRPLHLGLTWRILETAGRNGSIFIHVYDSRGDRIAQKDTYPGGGALVTSTLAPGDQWEDHYTLWIPPDAHPGVGHVDVGIYDYATMINWLATTGAGEPLERPTIATFMIHAPTPPPRPATRRVTYLFGDALELIGYRLDRCEASAGGEIAGGLYWRDRAPVDRDYTVFLHLTAANRHPVAQEDRLLGDTLYPTSLWQPGDEVYHPFRIVLAHGLPPGRYTLVVGLYELSTGQRLTIAPSPRQLLARLIHRLRYGTAQDATTGALETILVGAAGQCSPADGLVPAMHGRLGDERQASLADPASPAPDRVVKPPSAAGTGRGGR